MPIQMYIDEYDHCGEQGVQKHWHNNGSMYGTFDEA